MPFVKPAHPEADMVLCKRWEIQNVEKATILFHTALAQNTAPS